MGYGGGILGAGINTNGSVICESCWSNGNISGTNSGGICGSGWNLLTVLNCYSTGLISGENSGGICGAYQGGENLVLISGCYSLGNITGFASGGIAGAFGNNLTILNCYSSGTRKYIKVY